MDRIQFLKERKAVGASEVAAVLGLSKFDTPASVYDRITLLLDHDVVGADEDTGDAERGRVLEPVVAEIYRSLLPDGVEFQYPVGHDDLLDDDGTLLLRSHPDGLVIEDGIEGIVEIKNPRSPKFSYIKGAGLPPDWIVQGQAQLAARKSAAFVEYVVHGADEWDTLVFRIMRDNEYINRVIIPAVRKFVRENVEPRVRPNDAPPEAYIPWDKQVMQSDDPELARAAHEYHEAGIDEKTCKEIKREARAKIEEILGDSRVCIVDGLKISFPWVVPKTGRINKDKLVAVCKDAGIDPDQFTDEAAPYRRLTINSLS